MSTIRIATRNSPMALWQAKSIQSQIQSLYPNLVIELIEFVTQGDRDQRSSLAEIGGKSLFCKKLQRALLNNEADIAVHCIKDMSVHSVKGLMLAAVCQRDDPRDAFISNSYDSFSALPKGATVGTTSPRRRCILKSYRPDINVKICRGNANTRLQKLDNGEFDAIILAAAGLHRLGLNHRIKEYFSTQFMIPAIAQGSLGIECRENDETSVQYVRHLHHEPSSICIEAEREVNRILGGDCHTPIAAYAEIINDQLSLHALIGSEDGTMITTSAVGDKQSPQTVGQIVANDLLAKGASHYV